MSTAKRRILVTAALPYANGDIHIGHMVEYLQTDIWCRFQRLQGNQCIYLCADDAHGTPIMLRARSEGISPQALIDDMQKRHESDFAGFRIEFAEYYSTHSEENKEQAQQIYRALRDAGHIHSKTIEQAFDPEAQMFLPDRFIRGTCPRCQADDQYGDSCESCGATYDSSELINPVSVVSGKPPIQKESEHYFFKLGNFQPMLETWIGEGRVQPEVRNKLKEWLDGGLRDWDISRDAPYWGFEIPDTTGKYFYVWLDAPVGYMATTRKYCERTGENFSDYWGKDSTAEVHHFIGKDISYFHTLFWPAMLAGSNYRTPTSVYCHGFLTVDGKKMSKSRGTFISARTYLDHLDPEYLRYYIAAKLSSGLDDIDLNLQDFEQRINSDLVGKLVNIASRCAGILGKRFDSELSDALPDPKLYEEFAGEAETIAAFYEGREYSKAIRAIMALADKANQYIADKAPWKLAKVEATLAEAQAVCTQGINLYRMLITYLSPVVPRIFKDSCALLPGVLTWDSARVPLLGQAIEPFSPLIQRVDPEKVKAMLEASRPADTADSPAHKPSKKKSNKGTQATSKEKGKVKNASSSAGDFISFEDFAKVDLRVAKVVHAENVEGADKLLRVKVELAGGETRSILAGIKEAYSADDLVGRHIVVVANLAPRKMRFGVSEGMIIAAGPGGSEIFLLSPDTGGSAGMVVK